MAERSARVRRSADVSEEWYGIRYNLELPCVEVHLNISIGFILYNLHHSLTWYTKGLLHDILLLSSKAPP